MDDVESVIVSVSGQVDVGQAEQWFTVVCEAYDDFGENWGLFKDALATRAYSASFSSDAAETFIRVMENEVSDTSGVLRQMCVDHRDQLPRLYESLVAEERQALAELTGQGAATEAPAREFGEHAAAWYQHLTKDWAGWSGKDEDWETFTYWFRQYAESASMLAEADNLIARVEAASNKIDAFAELGITITVEIPAAGAVAGETAAEDERWRTFLRENASRYRGTAASWTFFRGWVLAEAGTQGLGSYAEAFVEYADAFSNKNEAFAAYGITAGGAPVEEAAPAAEAAPEQVAQQIVGDVTDAVLDGAPSAADLPRADVERLIAEILRERATAGA